MSAQNFFGGMLQGLLGGFAQGKLQQDDRKYQEKLANQKNILGFFQELMGRPDLTPEARKWAMQGLQAASQGDFGSAKKLMEAVNLLGQGPQKMATIEGPPAGISALNKEGKITPDRQMAAGMVPGLGNLQALRGGMPTEQVPTIQQLVPESDEGVFYSPDYLAEQGMDRELRLRRGIEDLATQRGLAIEEMRGQWDVYQQQAKESSAASERKRKADWIKANPNASPEETFVETGYRKPAGSTRITDQDIAFGDYAERKGLDPAKLTGIQQREAMVEYKRALHIDSNKEKLGELTSMQAVAANRLASRYDDLIKQTNFPIIQQFADRVRLAAKNPSAVGDLSLIFAYMKILDPGSVVRESEYATAQNAAGVPERVRNLYNKVVDGLKLGPKQRSDFVQLASEYYNNDRAKAQQLNNEFANQAKMQGLPSEAVILPLPEPIKLKAESEVRTVNGVPYKFDGKQWVKVK